MGIKATKTDLVRDIAERLMIPQADAKYIVEAALSFITRTVDAGGSVTVKGFGTFEMRTRAARTGRNPQTGAAMEIPASTTMGFRAAKRVGA